MITNMERTTAAAPDDGRRPDEVGRTLAQAALQATARALHTAQIALDACGRMPSWQGAAGMKDLQAAMGGLRDALADAYGAVPEEIRREILSAPGTIGGDELLDLLATLVSARSERDGWRAARCGHADGNHNNNNKTNRER
jgi:hypothetical protein